MEIWILKDHMIAEEIREGEMVAHVELRGHSRWILMIPQDAKMVSIYWFILWRNYFDICWETLADKELNTNHITHNYGMMLNLKELMIENEQERSTYPQIKMQPIFLREKKIFEQISKGYCPSSSMNMNIQMYFMNEAGASITFSDRQVRYLCCAWRLRRIFSGSFSSTECSIISSHTYDINSNIRT